jgi:hypothetical protein
MVPQHQIPYRSAGTSLLHRGPDVAGRPLANRTVPRLTDPCSTETPLRINQMAYDYLSAVLTERDAAQKIEAGLTSMRHKVTTIKAILVALQPFEGRQINKRLATAVQKALPNHSVHWSTEYGTKLYVWGAGLAYDDRISLSVQDPEGLYRHASMVRPYDESAPYSERLSPGAAWPYLRYEEEIPKWEALLPNLGELVSNFNTARETLNRSVAAFAPAGYAVFASHNR